MKVTHFSASGPVEKSASDLPVLLLDEQHVVWVDMRWDDNTQPESADLHALEKVFKFHPLAIEDTRNDRQRPKIEEYPNHYFMILNAVGYENGDLIFREMDVFFGKNFLVTVHYSLEPVIDQMHRRLAKQTVPATEVTCSMLVYYLTYAVVDSYFPIIDKVSANIDRMETIITESPDKVKLDNLFTLKRDLTEMWRIVSQQREMFNVMMHRDAFTPNATMRYFFRDVYDHMVLISDTVNMYRDTSTSLLDFFLSASSHRLNVVVNRLAVITIVIGVFTVISGFYGMNFDRTWPATDDPNGVPIVLVMMFSAAGIVYLWLKSRQLN